MARRDSLLMAKALFPGAAHYMFVDGPSVRVTFHDPAEFIASVRAGLDPESSPGEVETINLEIITVGPPWVMAGISGRLKKVFIYEEPESRT